MPPKIYLNFAGLSQNCIKLHRIWDEIMFVSTCNEHAGRDCRDLQIDPLVLHWEKLSAYKAGNHQCQTANLVADLGPWRLDISPSCLSVMFGWNIQSNVLNSMSHLPNILQTVSKNDPIRVRIVSIIVSCAKSLHPVHVTGACCIPSNGQMSQTLCRPRGFLTIG